MSSKTVEQRALEWIFSDDTGSSSEAICGHMLGVKKTCASYPSDPSDLGRCLRLLELIPEWKPRIKEMGVYGPGWAGQVEQWGSLAATMAEEVGIDWNKAKRAPDTYKAMRLAQSDGYRKDPKYLCTFDSDGYLQSSYRSV